MSYALRLQPDTNRVAFATEEQYGMEGDPIVESFPENISDYLFINGEFVYSPLPPNYPICDQDVEMGRIFMLDEDIYKARIAIGKGEPVTPYNSDKITPADILNMLAEQKGE